MTRAERIVTEALWLLSVAVLLAFVFFMVGCSRFTLRPVQRDHQQRLAEIHARLGTDADRLNSMLLYDQATCDRLDSKVMGWTGTTVVAGVLGGGSGLASIFTTTTPRIVVSSTSVLLATVTSLSAYFSTSYAQKYARGCAVNAGGSGP